jgi:hypothetical protein
VEAAGLGHGDWTVGQCLAWEVLVEEGRHPVLRMGIAVVYLGGRCPVLKVPNEDGG